MKQWFENLNRKFSNWMIGRYGVDEFTKFLTIVGLVLMLASYFFSPLYIFAWIVIIYGYFRCFSKNIIKRSRERDWYLKIANKIKARPALWKRMWHDRKTHKYFRCPKCKTMVRVPKGKGKIAITCAKCREEFIKTT